MKKRFFGLVRKSDNWDPWDETSKVELEGEVYEISHGGRELIGDCSSANYGDLLTRMSYIAQDEVEDKVTGRGGTCIGVMRVEETRDPSAENGRFEGQLILCSCGGHVHVVKDYQGMLTEEKCECGTLYDSSGGVCTRRLRDMNDMDEYYTRCGAEDGE